MSKLHYPKWQKEFDTYRTFRSTIILEGNVLDVQAIPDEDISGYTNKGVDQYLDEHLSSCGYKCILHYNRVDGFSDINKVWSFFPNLKSEFQCHGNTSPKFSESVRLMRKIVNNISVPSAIIIDWASLLVADASNISDADKENWGSLYLASLESKQAQYEDEDAKRNLLIFIVNKVGDIPTWFYLENPNSKVIFVEKPNKLVRQFFWRKNLKLLQANISEEELNKQSGICANLTDGFTNMEMQGLVSICRERKIDAYHIKNAINLYKYGEKESKWDNLDVDSIKNAKARLENRVVGQPHAVTKACDVLFRATSGLSDIQTNSIGHPKGVLFLAGPTGTGKTELAKALAELIFDDENAIKRFDMSEYKLEQSDQRLIGPPPGYIGYEAGGQLTNAVKENPFSVLLFDEIDKANPKIMDKFLQILEDGRLTDSSGETVYFSECLIVFTSNAGMDKDNEVAIKYNYQKITPSMSYDEINAALCQNIKKFFDGIGRPEILNRIGNNVVVFNYIQPEAARMILEKKLQFISMKFYDEKNIYLNFDKYIDFLTEQSKKYIVDYGGRGIVNMLEEYVVNPLARVLWSEIIPIGKTIFIQSISQDGNMQYEIN